MIRLNFSRMWWYGIGRVGHWERVYLWRIWTPLMRWHPFRER